MVPFRVFFESLLCLGVTAQLRDENHSIHAQLETSFKLLQQFQDVVSEQLPSAVADFVEDCQEKTKVTFLHPKIFKLGFVVYYQALVCAYDLRRKWFDTTLWREASYPVSRKRLLMGTISGGSL